MHKLRVILVSIFFFFSSEHLTALWGPDFWIDRGIKGVTQCATSGLYRTMLCMIVMAGYFCQVTSAGDYWAAV